MTTHSADGKRINAGCHRMKMYAIWWYPYGGNYPRWIDISIDSSNSNYSPDVVHWHPIALTHLSHRTVLVMSCALFG